MTYIRKGKVKDKLMLEKKFRIRIRHALYSHLSETHLYYIEYAYYRIFPIWKTIQYWIAGSVQNYNSLYRTKEAKELVCKLQTIEDVEDYISEQKKFELKTRKRLVNVEPEFRVKEFTNGKGCK